MTETDILIEWVRNVRRIITAWHTAEDIANMLIANDIVPVIRCKDCKWVYRDKYSGVYFCHERQVRSEHFCSYGERKIDA